MPYDLDVRDAHFARPRATIRVACTDGDELAPIEIHEIVVAPSPLTIDHPAKLEAARQIANFESAQAEQIAARLENTDPILAQLIRQELERRAARPQQHTTLRSEIGNRK
jgi:hypothetical protein